MKKGKSIKFTPDAKEKLQNGKIVGHRGKSYQNALKTLKALRQATSGEKCPTKAYTRTGVKGSL
jgi:hypothetical protein